MDKTMWTNLTSELRGILLIIFGIALLLHTMNVLRPLFNWILITFSIILIVQGAIELRLVQRIQLLFRRKQ